MKKTIGDSSTLDGFTPGPPTCRNQLRWMIYVWCNILGGSVAVAAIESRQDLTPFNWRMIVGAGKIKICYLLDISWPKFFLGNSSMGVLRIHEFQIHISNMWKLQAPTVNARRGLLVIDSGRLVPCCLVTQLLPTVLLCVCVWLCEKECDNVKLWIQLVSRMLYKLMIIL